MAEDTEAAHLRETLRRRATAEALTGRKWDAQDTVALLSLAARLAAAPETHRNTPEPPGW